ncbi:MAG: NAD+ synthase, partial [Planctomycetota bacterium]
MRIALAQRNVLVADLDGIARDIRLCHDRALAAGAELLVLPELASLGYPPRDLLHRRSLIRAQWEMIHRLAGTLELPTLIGCVHPGEDAADLGNALALLADTRVAQVYRKRLLPSYDVFDEVRYFQPGAEPMVVEIAGARVALSVCEDIWTGALAPATYERDPVVDLVGACDLVVNVSASPYNANKPALRRRLIADVAQRVGAPVVYVNQVGGYDELLFDGDSGVVGPDGTWYGHLQRWREDLAVIDTAAPGQPPAAIDELADLHQALVTGLRDYCAKTGQDRVVLGLSGGIDSALCAVLAVDALGAEGVTGLLMPSMHSSPESVTDAQALADNLGIRAYRCPIIGSYDAITATLAEPFAGTDAGVAEENIQARIRGTLVMAYANKHRAMALATGNKSELAVGYCTMYGDMNGGLAPIGDVYKTRVFALAGHLNHERERIPRNTILKPPSAELRPGQVDTDSLPPYPVLHRILEP